MLERKCTAEEMLALLTTFQAEGEEVLTAVHMILTNVYVVLREYQLICC